MTQVSIFGVIAFSAKQVNREALLTSERFIASVIADKLDQQEILSKDYAFWDDTIKNAYRSQNSRWITENVGEYLTDTFGTTDLLVIDEQDQAVLSLKDGQLDAPNYLSFDQDGLKQLIEQARQSSPQAVPASGILMIKDEPALVAVSNLQPENMEPLPLPSPVLVVAKRLNSEYLKTLSAQYRLVDLQFSAGSQNIGEEAHFIISNPQKEIIGILGWLPDKPGSQVLEKIFWPLILVFVVSVLITVFAIKASRTITRSLVKAHEELSQLANYDFLTGLVNRRLFNMLLEQMIHTVKRNNSSCAMLYLDLDGFKKVNDTFGHPVGDQLLVVVSERLKHILRESDIIARIGGDEFVVLLQDISKREDIETIVHKIHEELSKPVQLSNHHVEVGVSIGITRMPDDGLDAETLLKKADLALYRSKELGRNTFQFYSE